MPAVYEIRANYDRDTIVIYQAYAPNIADVALKQQRFASPFSFHRMTWIKDIILSIPIDRSELKLGTLDLCIFLAEAL